MSQDELLALFSRNLTLEPVRSVGQVEVPNEEPRIIYSSCHYVQPTSYVAPPSTTQVTTPAPQPPTQPRVDHTDVLAYLTYRGVKTSGLGYAQLELFKTVEEQHRTLLIEVWKAAPPTEVTLTLATTTVEQEVTNANLRYEQMQEEEAQAQLQAEAEAAAAAAQQSSAMMMDDTPLTPVQSNEGAWIQMTPTHYMEPYMLSGYEEMARREYEESARNALAEGVTAAVKDINHGSPVATGVRPTFNPAHADPVYKSRGVIISDFRRQQEEMENQYGRLPHW